MVNEQQTTGNRQLPIWLRFLAAAFGLLVAGFYGAAVWQLRGSRPGAFWLMLVVGALGLGAVLWQIFRRRPSPQAPFPAAWRAVLENQVSWYRRLQAPERERFEREVQLFLEEKRITGVETEVEEEVRVLVAASAIIPVFGFPGWRYPNLEEVLLYPNAFSDDYQTEGPGRSLLGLMGEEELSRVVLLSKPDLLEGFRRGGMAPHPGIHEFIHRFDAADGALDGVPELGETDPEGWLDLVAAEMDRLSAGASSLDPYALTNEAEFLAVAGETFFLRPDLLNADHPQLYRRMSAAFRQDPLRRRLPSGKSREPSPYLFRPRRNKNSNEQKNRKTE